MDTTRASQPPVTRAKRLLLHRGIASSRFAATDLGCMFPKVIIRLPRRVAALTLIAALPLELVGSGYACGLPMPGASGVEAMAGMPMPAATQTFASSPEQAPGKSTCDFPSLPGGCQAMAPCAPPAMGSTELAYVEPLLTLSGAPMSVIQTPASYTRAPEPPPPRA